MSEPTLRVYIPTRGRVGLNRQPTLREFLAKSDERPILVCPPGEVAAHRRYYRRVLPCPAEGIGPTRQWIMEATGAGIAVVASDDLRFSYRPDPAVPKLEKCGDVRPMLDGIRGAAADGYFHGGVGMRQGNNTKDVSGPRAKGTVDRGHLFVDCERVNDFHWLVPAAVRGLGARWDALPVMEDFHFTLTLLTRGYPNRVMHDYVWNQEGSGSVGGCSLYRTAAVQAAGARGLVAAFPRFVKLVTKVSKDTSPAWRDFKERLDVIVYWWKAYQSYKGPKRAILYGYDCPARTLQGAETRRAVRVGPDLRVL
jgi:3',5'-cyclic AMP phosphodiesterase CpdA